MMFRNLFIVGWILFVAAACIAMLTATPSATVNSGLVEALGNHVRRLAHAVSESGDGMGNLSQAFGEAESLSARERVAALDRMLRESSGAQEENALDYAGDSQATLEIKHNYVMPDGGLRPMRFAPLPVGTSANASSPEKTPFLILFPIKKTETAFDNGVIQILDDGQGSSRLFERPKAIEAVIDRYAGIDLLLLVLFCDGHKRFLSEEEFRELATQPRMRREQVAVGGQPTDRGSPLDSEPRSGDSILVRFTDNSKHESR